MISIALRGVGGKVLICFLLSLTQKGENGEAHIVLSPAGLCSVTQCEIIMKEKWLSVMKFLNTTIHLACVACGIVGARDKVL